MTRRLLVALAVLVSASALMGCGGSTPSASGSSGSSGSNSNTITFKETEYSIQPASLSLKPGKYTFKVQNVGQFPHDLHVASAADTKEVAFSKVVEPNQAENFSVTLASGSYLTWCAVDGHKALGMTGTLTVK
jgi:uncharacterized cupredoxin-like copper-binding protein